MKVSRDCPCGQEFTTHQRLIEQGRGRYCSRPCMYRYRTRPVGLKYKLKVQNSSWYVPGHAPTAGAIKRGERRSPGTEFKPGQRVSRGTEFKPGAAPWNAGTTGRMPSGPNHHAWAGDDVGYDALHDWVRARKPASDACDFCGIDSPLDLSNISGEYQRNVRDWQYLCRSCHFRHDRENIPGAYVARFPERTKKWLSTL